MAQMSMPPGVAALSQKDEDAAGFNVYPSQSSAAFAPKPNPSFVFPMPSLEDTSSVTKDNPLTKSANTTSFPGGNRHRPNRIDIDSVPAFSFPSPTTPPATTSPQASPTRIAPASRPSGGHRRGGSEFIGGDGSTFGRGLMSSSPTKGDNALPSPQMGGRRRGHAHRRSGAISQHDLSTILKPADKVSHRAGSAPATPCEGDLNKQLAPSLDRSTSQPTLPHASPDSGVSPKLPDTSSPPTVQARPRVGFSDKLEYIPRPLSTISSATSSSMSTVRPSHSLSGSISSLKSNTSSPSSAEKSRVEDVFGGNLHASVVESPNEDSSERVVRIPIKTPYRYSPPPPDLSDSEEEDPFSTSVQDNSLFGATPNSYPELAANPSAPIDEEGLDDFLAEPEADPEEMKGASASQSEMKFTGTVTTDSEGKRQKRGKSWTGLLSSKSKPSESTGSPSDTTFSFPPTESMPVVGGPQSSNIHGLSLDDVNFDEDSTFVLRSPEFDVPRSAPAHPTGAWGSDSNEDADQGDVLDLDAVWAAAGTEIRSRMNAEAARQRKRRMHSSGTTGGFAGPGWLYHRRTESAPVMAPVDSDFGFPRFGSNPQMADVFEEDEDAENQKVQDEKHVSQPKALKASQKGRDSRGQATDVKASATVATQSLASGDQPKSTSRIEDHPEVRPDLNVEIVDPVDEPRFSVVTKSSDESTITPTLSNEPLRTRPIPASLDFAPPGVDQFPGLSSMNPSPSPAKSSFDVPRLGTAYSSTTERSGWSSARVGDGGTEVGYSTEDVPSLTSSASTMISHPVPFTPVVGSRPDAERSQSLCEAVPARPATAASTSKRRSLASLSMLRLGSSSGKSKLSIESRPGPEGEDAERSKKKRHRISRMMKFWKKSKEDLKA